MKTTMKYALPFMALLSLNGAQAAVSIINDPIDGLLNSSSNTAPRDVAAKEWRQKSGGGWFHGTGNTWMYTNSTEEGGLVHTVSLGGLGLTTEGALDVSFNYSAWGNGTNTPGADDLYVHVWAMKDVSSVAASGVADLTGTNGDLFGDATDFAKFIRYNLKDGNVLASANASTASTAAFSIQNMKLSDTNTGASATGSFQLNMAGAIADYDYLVIGFARDVDAGTTENFALREVYVDAVPEPSSAALLGLGGLALILRRRK